MKKRVILSSLILSLVFLLSSCGVPNWFYISSSDARISNSTGSNATTTISVSSDYALDVDVFLLYTIHDATTSSEPKTSQIQSGLRSAFTTRYRINDANSNRFSSGFSSVADYTYTSRQIDFHLYPLKPVGDNVPLNSGDSPLFRLQKTFGGTSINNTITYEMIEENGNRYLQAVLHDSSGNEIDRVSLARFNSSAFGTDENIGNDSNNDHQHIDQNDYNLYVWPVMYISSTSASESGHRFNNLMLVTASSFLSFDL